MNKNAKTSILLLRLGIGWLFLYAGWSKVITFFTSAKDWSAAGFLGNLEGPFAGLFASMSGSPVIDYLNAYGLLLIGLAITLGLLVRFASFWGIVLMLLYYFAGYPPNHAFIIDDHLIDVLVFVVLAGAGAGRYMGLDAMIEKSALVKKNRWLLKILG